MQILLLTCLYFTLALTAKTVSIDVLHNLTQLFLQHWDYFDHHRAQELTDNLTALSESLPNNYKHVELFDCVGLRVVKMAQIRSALEEYYFPIYGSRLSSDICRFGESVILYGFARAALLHCRHKVTKLLISVCLDSHMADRFFIYAHKNSLHRAFMMLQCGDIHYDDLLQHTGFFHYRFTDQEHRQAVKWLRIIQGNCANHS